MVGLLNAWEVAEEEDATSEAEEEDDEGEGALRP
jgi:hypothetical protein